MVGREVEVSEQMPVVVDWRTMMFAIAKDARVCYICIRVVFSVVLGPIGS